MKLQWMNEKLRLQNAVTAGKYINRDRAFLLVDKLLESEEAFFAGYGEGILKRIEKEFGIIIDKETRADMQSYLDESAQSAHNTIKKIIADFKREYAPHPHAEKDTA